MTGVQERFRASLSDAQRRMLATLSHAINGVPVGLSDLSNPEFSDLMTDGLVNVAWVDFCAIKASITDAGRGALSKSES